MGDASVTLRVVGCWGEVAVQWVVWGTWVFGAIFSHSSLASSYKKPENYDSSKVMQVEQLRTAVEKSPSFFTSIESTLEWTAKHYPEQFSYYTLMKASRSLQPASWLDPRALVYGPEASFAFTFTGYHEGLEMYQAREGLKAYDFFEMTHDPEGGATIQKNPNRCYGCHEARLRPIWDEYDKWKGAYGEDDDVIIDFDSQKYPTSATPEYESYMREHFTHFMEYRARAKSHPRYRYLTVLASPPEFTRDYPEFEFKVAPYAPSSRYFNYDYRPNLRLTGLLAEQNAKRVTHLLQEDRDCFAYYGRVLLANLLRCDRAVGERMGKLRVEAESRAVKRFGEIDVTSWSPNGADLDGNMAMMLLLGVDKNDFNLSLDPKFWNYFEGGLFMHELVRKELYDAISAEGPALGQVETRSVYNALLILGKEGENKGEAKDRFGLVCSKILEPLPDPPPKELCAAPTAIEVPRAFPTCMGCHHGSGRGAPKIDFTDHTALKKEPLRTLILNRIKSSDPNRRMPPLRTLSRHEKEELKIFFGD